ncbi:glycoside hydrolase 43 family protein [Sodalis sp. RH19]|uniref:glycoside hydrolase family 43 protein n=1 Tax=unclassified Sodalis (in: enterobacteria) TaxID=2636512 RepID=UPI0039B3D074
MHDNELSPWRPDRGDGTYQNPVLHADYSDPDIVRVGDDFYLVASSFNHMPGLPILHSTDLVNWQIVNHVLPCLALPGYDAFQPGKGVWAPSIRYHAGLFWVFFSTPDEGIFMCRTTDPLGEWSAPHCLKQAKGWIDPCPFWDDDGRAWLVHAFAYSRSGIKHRLQLCAMSPDGQTLLDEGQALYDGSADLPTLEGPKLYKRHGWYYIFAPAGGVATGWQAVLRARSIQGPYEARKILSQGNTAVNGPHQGGWVELDNGESWFMHFQDAGTYGRLVHLQPLRWVDDWPVIACGEPVERWVKPATALSRAPCEPRTSDDFLSARPGLQWQWQANPQPYWASLDNRGLHLACEHLPLRDGQPSLYDAANLLLQKFPAREFTLTTRMTADLRHDGEQAGIIIYGERYAALSVQRSQGRYCLTWDTGWRGDGGEVNISKRDLVPWPDATPLYLRITVRRDAICTFSYGADGQAFTLLPTAFAAGPGKWVGAKAGLFAVARNKGDGQAGTANFSFFTVSAAV